MHGKCLETEEAEAKTKIRGSCQTKRISYLGKKVSSS